MASAPLVVDAPTPKPASWRDFVELSKPGILGMCLFTAAGAMAVAATLGGYTPTPFPWPQALWGLLGTTLSVAASNTLNQWIERDGDRLMNRTKDRPLPAGRMAPAKALIFGVVLGIASVAVLYTLVNEISAWISTFALLSYVLIYTPMKRRSRHALLVGAVPGAMPPLLGWAIVTGDVHAPGIVLAAILGIWQLPHFIAISIYRARDYENAGIHVSPNERGLEFAKNESLWYSLLLVASSMLLVPLQVAGFFYFVVVSVLGAWFFILSMRGFEPDAGNKWARQFFFASLIYLPALTIALIVDLAIQ
ncbi:MAG: protoheme IX farnesyltransferase [Bradymonadia bacterium]|jgi:protoheme IX farnesyltransferase